MREWLAWSYTLQEVLGNDGPKNEARAFLRFAEALSRYVIAPTYIDDILFIELHIVTKYRKFYFNSQTYLKRLSNIEITKHKRKPMNSFSSNATSTDCLILLSSSYTRKLFYRPIEYCTISFPEKRSFITSSPINYRYIKKPLDFNTQKEPVFTNAVMVHAHPSAISYALQMLT